MKLKVLYSYDVSIQSIYPSTIYGKIGQSITITGGYFGVITGNTLSAFFVVIMSGTSSDVKCKFGHIEIMAQIINKTTIVCTSPNVDTYSTLGVSITLNHINYTSYYENSKENSYFS